jgi:hypothetical protein
VSDYVATAEISYLAFARFGWDPDLSWDRFMERDVAPLFGGRTEADQFVAIAEEIDARAVLPVERLDELMSQVLEHLPAATPAITRRWLSLADRVARRRHMGR